MDTDVEIIRPIDALLSLGCFIGFQHEWLVSNGLIVGAEANEPFIQENAAIYKSLSFVNEDGSYNQTVCQEYTTEILKKYGLMVPDTGEIQIVNGVHVFPAEYFCPYNIRTFKMNRTRNTYSVHHYASSWCDDKDVRSMQRMKRKVERANILHFIAHIPHRIGRSLIGDERYERLKQKLGRKL